MTSSYDTPLSIDRRADYQGSRPSVSYQTEVEKFTGCSGLSPLTRHGTRTQIKSKKSQSKLNYSDIKVATINVRTLQEDMKLVSVIEAAEKCKIDVLAMQETRRTGCDWNEFQDESIRGWKMVWSGCKRKKLFGVAILLAPHVQLESHSEHLPARILSCVVQCKGLKLAVLNVYAPTDEASPTTKTAFYSALGKAKLKLDEQPRHKVITLGDFNATISSSSKDSGAWDHVLGHNNADRIENTDNGDRMLAWCLKHKMKILNTMFRSKRIHRGTWKNPKTGRWKRIDYICTSGWLAKFAKSCRVFIGPSVLFDTDHRLLVLDIRFPQTKRSLKYHLSRTTVCRDEVCRIDFKALEKDLCIQNNLTEFLEARLESPALDLDELNEEIVSAVRQGMEEVCPKIAPRRKKQPWKNAELENMVKKLSCTKNHRDMRKLQEEIKKKRIQLKNEYYKEIADGINGAAQAREVEKEFAMMKKYSVLKTNQGKSISNEKLKTHFEKHFSAREIALPPELEHPEKYPYLQQLEMIEIDESVPSTEETKKALQTFKNGRSGGTDKMKTEGLKYNSSCALLAAVLNLMALIWSLVRVPSTWLHANITCLYKKGAMNVGANYRGISIGANMSRILAKIILARMKEAYETHLGERQFGFRRNKSTSDAIFIMKSVVQKHGGTLVAVYIDLTAAYDHIPRDFLFRVLQIRTGASHLIAILRKMYEGTTASIKGMETAFDVLVGCRQGGQESPCLFNYYLDFVLKVAADEIDKRFPDGWGIDFEYSISHLCTNRLQRRSGRMHGVQVMQWILYADDAVLFCKSPEEAQELLTIIDSTFKRFGLTTSYLKTKTQVFNDVELAQKKSLFSIDSHEIENVAEFTYLGQVFTTAEGKCFTDHRIARATAKFNELRNALCDTDINLKTRRKLLEACVRSCLTYGLQACYPKENEMKKLEACWSSLLRTMVKGGWKRKDPEDDGEEEYRLLYSNEKVQNIIKSVPLRNFIEAQYLRYIDHVCRSSNRSLTKIMLFSQPSRRHLRDPWIHISNLLGISIDQAKTTTQTRSEFAALIRQRTSALPQR